MDDMDGHTVIWLSCLMESRTGFPALDASGLNTCAKTRQYFPFLETLIPQKPFKLCAMF